MFGLKSTRLRINAIFGIGSATLMVGASIYGAYLLREFPELAGSVIAIAVLLANKVATAVEIFAQRSLDDEADEEK